MAGALIHNAWCKSQRDSIKTVIWTALTNAYNILPQLERCYEAKIVSEKQAVTGNQNTWLEPLVLYH